MIKNAKYLRDGSISVEINGNLCFVPDDINNAERQMIAQWESEDNEIEPYIPEPEPVVTIVPALTLWRRMTNDEAEQVNGEMQKQPFRMRKIFETAANFRSDDDLWPLLEQIATQLFGTERANELLAGE